MWYCVHMCSVHIDIAVAQIFIIRQIYQLVYESIYYNNNQ